MIGILFLVGIVIWFVVSVVLSAKIPRWLRVTKFGTAISVLLFPLVLATPFADEMIGRWQFNRLCKRQAVVSLSSDWREVRKARVDYLDRTEIGNSMIPIYSEVSQYVDLETDKIFLTIPHLYTYGGFLFGRVGIGLGGSTSCWPEDWIQVTNELNIDHLLKQGKTK